MSFYQNLVEFTYVEMVNIVEKKTFDYMSLHILG